MNLCFCQEFCLKYETGDTKPKNHDVRNKWPCKRWLAMDCEKIWILGELQEFTTGKVFACETDKIKKIKERIK